MKVWSEGFPSGSQICKSQMAKFKSEICDLKSSHSEDKGPSAAAGSLAAEHPCRRNDKGGTAAENLSFDHADGSKPRYPFRDAGLSHRLDNIRHIFVSVRHLFGHRPPP